MIFQNLSKNGEMLKNVGENIKKNVAMIFFYTMDIKNTIFNPKFYQHFLPSLLMSKLKSRKALLVRMAIIRSQVKMKTLFYLLVLSRYCKAIINY